MADYYPLIARAIAGLDPSAPGEARRALYERARAALIAQLRSVQPPLSRIRNHPGAAVAGRGGAQGRIRSRPARPRGLARRIPLRRCVPRRHRPREPHQAGRFTAAGPRAPAKPAGAAAATQSQARAAGAVVRSESAAAAFAAAAAAAFGGHAGPDAAAGAVPARRAVPMRPRSRRTRPSRRACAVFAISPPTPTISAAPRRKPTARREKPMPTCRRPRRNSTGSSRAWRTAAPIPTCRIPMTSSPRKPRAGRRRRISRARARARRTRNARRRPRAPRASAAAAFRSRARSPSASC